MKNCGLIYPKNSVGTHNNVAACYYLGLTFFCLVAMIINQKWLFSIMNGYFMGLCLVKFCFCLYANKKGQKFIHNEITMDINTDILGREFSEELHRYERKS